MRKSRVTGLIVMTMVLTASTKSLSLDNQTVQNDHDHQLCEGFLPKNKMRIEVGQGSQKMGKGVVESEFNNVISKIETIYAPIIRKKGGVLKINRNWTNGEVNAYASRKGTTWLIDMFGGLARHPAITSDGLALVLCHELGHHLGGAPLYSGDPWAAVEGQADYFATLKCLRRVFLSEAETWNGNVDAVAKEKCEASFGVNTTEAKLCERLAMAGKSSADLTRALSGGAVPRFDVKDRSVVTKTFEAHPKAQCRMDTYFNGSLCQVSMNVETSLRDHNVGVCKNTVEEEYGARARCWYKPQNNSQPIDDPIIPPPKTNPDPNPDPNPNPDPVPGPTEPTIAKTPLLSGQTQVTTNNPNLAWTLSYDVTDFKGAYGVYIEIIGPNREISKPNGVIPEPGAIQVGSIAKRSGSLRILPSQQLPNWGKYYFRVIPLDRTGRKAVGEFSNPSVLLLQR